MTQLPKIQPPIKDYSQMDYPNGNITQWFGENPDMYAFLGLAGHNGIDIVAPYGTPILATTTQKIVDVKYTPDGYGKHIRAVDENYEYTYGHLSEINACSLIGYTVEAGTEIGKMGNTGFVVSGETPFWEYNPYAGTHLHFGIRPLSKSGACVNYPTGRVYIKDYPGNYMGAIDPAPIIDWEWGAKKPLMLTIIGLSNQVIALLQKLIRLKS